MPQISEPFVPERPMSSGQNDLLFGPDSSRVVEKLISDPMMEKAFRDLPFAGATSRTLKLTFLDKNEMSYLENLFEAQVCSYMRSIPIAAYTTNKHQMVQQLRMMFFANAKRSVGTETNKMNERIALLSQISYNTSSISDKRERGGLMHGILKTFGR